MSVLGGHSNSGYSTINDSGFVINLAKMNGISVDSDRIEVQGGALWGDVYELLNEVNSQQLVTGGMCPDVGVGGYTLGGGYSVLSRMYGLASDNVISMRMVTANGSKVVVANESMNSDLFWALRGSGGGNFGIVTNFTFSTHTVTYQNYVKGELKFEAGSKSLQALMVVEQVNAQIPYEMYLDILISSNKELTVSPIYLGSYDDALKYLKNLIDIASEAKFGNFTSYYTLLQTTDDNIFRSSSGSPILQRGCILNKMDNATATILFSLDFPDGCEIAFMHTGGAIADIHTNKSAFARRQGEFDYYARCQYQSKEEETAAYDFEDKLYKLMSSGGHCAGSYVNDMDKFLPHWQDMYYGGNYQQLLDVKMKWNPVGVGHFHFLQEIGSTYDPSQI